MSTKDLDKLVPTKRYKNCNFYKSDLRNIDLSEADLREANFVNTERIPSDRCQI